MVRCAWCVVLVSVVRCSVHRSMRLRTVLLSIVQVSVMLLLRLMSSMLLLVPSDRARIWLCLGSDFVLLSDVGCVVVVLVIFLFLRPSLRGIGDVVFVVVWCASDV